MAHNYKAMPPLWRIQEKVELTDEHPSGLRILKNGKYVERRHKKSSFYMVSIDAEEYYAHRVVYYLRTGQCPDRFSIKHAHPNPDFDNRKELVVTFPTRNKPKKSKWSFDYQEWS